MILKAPTLELSILVHYILVSIPKKAKKLNILAIVAGLFRIEENNVPVGPHNFFPIHVVLRRPQNASGKPNAAN